MNENLLESLFQQVCSSSKENLQIFPLLRENCCETNSSGPKFTDMEMVILEILPLAAFSTVGTAPFFPATPRGLTASRMRRALAKASRNDSNFVVSTLCPSNRHYQQCCPRAQSQSSLHTDPVGRCLLDSIIPPFWNLSCHFTVPYSTDAWQIDANSISYC